MSRTTRTIAHRLSTIKDASRILVFHDGQIAEQGTYDELMEADGRFHSMVIAQQLNQTASEECNERLY